MDDFLAVLLIIVFLLYLLRNRKPGKLKTQTYKGYKQYGNKKGKWVFTHRRVAEKKVRGKIWPGRVVHHKDGDKLNNRPSNLEIMSRSKHSQLHANKRKQKGLLDNLLDF